MGPNRQGEFDLRCRIERIGIILGKRELLRQPGCVIEYTDRIDHKRNRDSDDRLIGIVGIQDDVAGKGSRLLIDSAHENHGNARAARGNRQIGRVDRQPWCLNRAYHANGKINIIRGQISAIEYIR